MIATHLAYLRPATIAGWASSELEEWAADAASRGIGGAITKLDTIDDGVRTVLDRHGLQIIGSYTCYSDHRDTGVRAVPVRPVGPDGRELASMEWYHGVVPGDPDYDDALAAELERQLSRYTPDLVILDFIRWPGHWEIESRHGRTPRVSSFDVGTMARFARWLGVANADAQTVAHHPDEWARFRIDVVTRATARLAGIVRSAGARVGAFLVPLPDAARRGDYGQDVTALAPHVDLFALMTYQQMTGLSAESTLALADEVAVTGRAVMAMLQTTADPRFSAGWDWGPPIDDASQQYHVDTLDGAVRRRRIDALCCFPGEAPLPDFLSSHLPEGTPR